MLHSTETALIFADLQDALTDLDAARGSPKNVRRAFSRFIDLTQKLTSAMRKDFSRIKQAKWQASIFTGWTPITDLIKYLRNEDQHEHQIFISVHERRYYQIPTNLHLPVSIEPGQLFVTEGTWNLDDQLLDAPPERMTMYAIEPETSKPTNQEIEPVYIERFYILQARSEKIKSKLQIAGVVDVHALAHSAFSTLSEYYAFFRVETKT